MRHISLLNVHVLVVMHTFETRISTILNRIVTFSTSLLVQEIIMIAMNK